MRMLRVLAVALAALAVLYGLAFLAIRQPAPGSVPFLGEERADAERLRRHVEFLAIQAAPRDVDHPENLDRAADHIRESFARSGTRVEEQTYTAHGRSFRNVLASFGPASGPVLIVGAHYDAFGGFGENPGADDNASGTAGLLELARLLAGRPLARRVVLAAYSTEEPPFFGSPQMGSAVHARALGDAEVGGMICLEMIGFFAEEQPWPDPLLDLLYPDRGDFIGVTGRWADRELTREIKRALRAAGVVPVYSFTAPRSAGLDASDHMSYWNRGISAVMITDTAYLRNPSYHAPGDTAASLDYRRMAGVVDGVLNAVLHLSRKRPR
jgi:hypothetical protein